MDDMQNESGTGFAVFSAVWASDDIQETKKTRTIKYFVTFIFF